MWDDFQTALTSPTGQFAVGLLLFYGVQRFFKEVEEKLHPTTKLEIWMWLGEPHAERAVQPWPATFVNIFDSIFGKRHLTWSCFWRSCLASLVVATLFIVFPTPLFHVDGFAGFVVAFPVILLSMLLFNSLPDYFSLLETRWVLQWMSRSESVLVWCFAILFDLFATLCIASIAAIIFMFADGPPGQWREALSWRFLALFPLIGFTDTPQNRWIVFPAFFTSVWVWLYAASGFLLRAARRLDLGFLWMNRRFNMEEKPLQAIGLVAGALFTGVYWFAVAAAALWHRAFGPG